MASTPISAFKAADCDVLVGHVAYPSCGHEFGYVRDRTLDRTDDERWDCCPRCVLVTVNEQGVVVEEKAVGKCLVCLQPWNAADAAAASACCPRCDSFFDAGLLEERVAAIEARGLKWARDSILYVVSRSMQLKWKETRRERWLALAAAAKSAAANEDTNEDTEK
ncbi:hypothetical protein PG996_002490 [Apiospora saccharicola]|uniref:RING-type domain-containing protein n=1 Tax=Apiospora saccharicola TaxID=335842 RepID=A0ABR1WJL5_9PEZI